MGFQRTFCQLGLSITALFAIAVGCGDSPVAGPTCPAAAAPTRQLGIDKVDLLFAIDNSASMADKQQLFKDAVPDLVNALLTPDCSDGVTHVKATSSGGALLCPKGFSLLSAPAHDLHIGIVTSSLGGGGAPDVCEAGSGAPPPPVGNRHDDDRGHLVNRTSGTAEPPVDHARPIDTKGGNFLAWLPPGDVKNVGKPAPNVTEEADVATVIKDFQDLAVGVQEYGCGLEAQLESWYRFLVQPDPYDTIKLDTSTPPKASLDGYDATVLKQRKDFLRSDSLVAVIMLTDEEDSWSDPLALAGRGWTTRTLKFPGSPVDGAMARPTSECLAPVDVNNPTTTGPNNPNCTSCGFTGNKVNGTAIADDPECKKAAFYTATEDGLNVRYTNDMKRRYGFDPQFPVDRYIDGLKSAKVPDRDGEHKGGAGPYVGTKNCTNPLFAKDLPDGSNLDPTTLCNLPVGPRTPDLVLFAIIGGVPPQLLLNDPQNPASGFKGTLADGDWVKLLGKDPSTYQSDGIDPHMIESITPRAGLPGTTAQNGADPIHGREWKTTLSPAGLDLQYACTFPLPTPKNCNLPANAQTCECGGTASGPEGPPICNGSLQVRGKTYPTIRQLRVAKGLGIQGIVGSLCAVDASSPSYGYRPVIDALLQRLVPIVSYGCDPTAHPRGADGKVPCHVLVSFDTKAACDPARGLRDANASSILCFKSSVLEQLKQQNPNATLADVGPVCELAQIPSSQFQGGSCDKLDSAGWCYTLGSETGSKCAQSIVYTPAGTPVPGTWVSVQCDE